MSVAAHILKEYLSPLDVLDEHFAKLRDISSRLLAECERLRRAEVDLNVRLQDALDKVHELETRVRERDGLIEELQEMNRTRGER